MNFLAFDLESTGLDVTCDRIIEIAIVRDGATAFSARINPERPIPPEIAKLTGITDDDVRDCPSFAEVAPLVKAAFEGQIVAGYGINRFDLPLLCEEMFRAGVDSSGKIGIVMEDGAVRAVNEPAAESAALGGAA